MLEEDAKGVTGADWQRVGLPGERIGFLLNLSPGLSLSLTLCTRNASRKPGEGEEKGKGQPATPDTL